MTAEWANGKTEDVTGFSTLVVPDEYAQKLTDYLETLDKGGDGENDVSGFVMSLGLGRLSDKGPTQTQTASNCQLTTIGKGDVVCDTDVFTPF